MDPMLITILSAATALVASIAGPLVTLSVARRQFNANVLSANRQHWIESLRDALAELISLLVTVLVVKANFQGTWNKGLGVVAAEPKRVEKLQRLVNVQWKIRLLLNPTEADHQQLTRAIENAITRIQAEGSDDEGMNADIETITCLGQSILKREWQRVKRGE